MVGISTMQGEEKGKEKKEKKSREAYLAMHKAYGSYVCCMSG